MKKNLLTILIAVSLFATTLSGCGGKEAADEDERIESVENDTNETKDDTTTDDKVNETNGEINTDSTTGQAVTGEGVQVEGPDDGDAVISVEGDVTEITDGEVTEIIEGEVTEITDDEVIESVDGDVTEAIGEVTPDNTESVGENVTDVVPDDGIDWSVKYDDYFTRDNIMPEKLKVMVTADTNGMVYEMAAALVNETVFMSYDFGTVALDMYVMADKAYICTKMEGQEVWNFAPISPEEADDMTAGVEDNTALINSEHIGSVTYREALEEDGVIYDVLDVILEDGNEVPGTAVYFINRKTQQVAKCVIEQQGNTVICLVEEIESIELPAEAETATEVTMEDIMGALIGVMLMGSGADME